VPYARDTVFGSSLAWIGNTGDLMVHESNWQWEIMRFRLSQLKSIPVTCSRVDGSDRNFTQILAIPHRYGAQGFDVAPDGKKLAWVRRCELDQISPTKIEVRLGDLNSLSGETSTAGTVVFATSNDGTISKRGLCFSPDGSQLCISAARDGRSRGIGLDLYVLDLRTGKVTRLTRSGEEQGVWNLYPAWSSKDAIAFSSGPTRFGPCQLHLIRPDGSGLKRLTHNRYDNVHPSWSPDGKHLVFAAGMGSAPYSKGIYHLYVMQVA
jgi:Tol biopolymer transport system component